MPTSNESIHEMSTAMNSNIALKDEPLTAEADAETSATEVADIPILKKTAEQTVAFSTRVVNFLELTGLTWGIPITRLVAGEDLRLWMNVRGALREAGESPYRLEVPLVALLPGTLDEKIP